LIERVNQAHMASRRSGQMAPSSVAEPTASSARVIINALGLAIRPDRTTWAPAIDALHRSIDGALITPPPPDG